MKYVLGRMHISSCSLQMHLDNALADAKVYNCVMWDNDGEIYRDYNTSISEALQSQQWTHVSFQQVSGQSGIESSYGQTLTDLISYVGQYTSAYAQHIFYQTWAYGPDFTGYAFSNYAYDQLTMYLSIVNASKKIPDEYDIDMLVPAGTAIQNARQTELGPDLTRDGMHLSEIGRLVACLTWCEALTGHNSNLSTYRPAGISERECELAREAAHNAILAPYEVTLPTMSLSSFTSTTTTLTTLYDLQGRRVSTPSHGVYIESNGHKSRKVIYKD